MNAMKLERIEAEANLTVEVLGIDESWKARLIEWAKKNEKNIWVYGSGLFITSPSYDGIDLGFAMEIELRKATK